MEESPGNLYLSSIWFTSSECVEMRSSILLSMRSALLIIAIFIVFHFSQEMDARGQKDPLIEGDLELEIISPIDSEPLRLALIIPWGGGEPVISNVSYTISGSNWTKLEGWETMYTSSSNISRIEFPMSFEWGVSETLLIRVTDNMGINSTIGKTIVCSRPPLVDIMHISNDDSNSFPGEQLFSASASDPDGQKLSFNWKVDGIHASSEKMLVTYLDEGTHNISVEVSDGQWIIEKELDILISPRPIQKEDKEIDVLRVSSLIFLVIVGVALILFSIYAGLTTIQARMTASQIKNGERRRKPDTSSLSCDICLKGLKESQSSITCRCGARFHKGCGKKEGVCPECGREILI